MAKKSTVKPAEIEKIIARVKWAERVRDEADQRYGYTRALQEYRGDYVTLMPSWLRGLQVIPINEVYSYAKTFIPSVYSRDPYITVNPKGQKYILMSRVAELSVNAFWRELKLKKQVRRCIFDSVFAEGYIKVGFTASFGSIETEEGKPALHPSEFIKDEEIFATRVFWKNIVRDPQATDGLHDARFVAHKIVLPLEAVKSSSIYENTDQLRPNFVIDLYDRVGVYKTGQEFQEEYVVLWEVWDADMERVYTVAEGNMDFLMNKAWPYKFQGYPFVLLRFNEISDEPYAPNLIGPWEPQLWEKMKIRAMEMDHLKRFGRQMAAEKGSISKTEMDKYIKGVTGSVLQFEPGKNPPSPIQYPPIQADMYGVENRIDLDKDNISGQPNAVRSAPQRTQSRTLGEIDRLIAAFETRQNDPQDMVEDFAEEIATKLIGLMQQYFDAPRYVRATQLQMQDIVQAFVDDSGKSRFDGRGFVFSKKDIQGLEFDVDVRSGSTLPLDKKNRVEAMANLLKLGPTIGVTPGDKVSRVIGKNLIAEFDMPEITAAYDEVLRKMAAAEQVSRVAAVRQNELVQSRIAGLQGQVLNEMANGGGLPGASGGPGAM